MDAAKRRCNKGVTHCRDRKSLIESFARLDQSILARIERAHALNTARASGRIVKCFDLTSSVKTGTDGLASGSAGYDLFGSNE